MEYILEFLQVVFVSLLAYRAFIVYLDANKPKEAEKEPEKELTEEEKEMKKKNEKIGKDMQKIMSFDPYKAKKE